MPEDSRKRANGKRSAHRILEAAAAIGSERGYEGATINLISERSGLPASSIYWHFQNKDALFAAVIDWSFDQWLASVTAFQEDDELDEQYVEDAMGRALEAFTRFPDHMRLGVMLALERRQEEPAGRRRFLDARNVVADRLRDLFGRAFRNIEPHGVDILVTLTLAVGDGLFVATESGEIELADAEAVFTTAILAAAERLRTTP
ncbi:MAG: TetR/AcrR family transcriptional regulator [Ilumatobacteraceae bacterium]